MFQSHSESNRLSSPKAAISGRRSWRRSLGDGADTLNPEENVHASLMGLAVDYLTRFMTGAPAEDAFCISLRGAKRISEEKRAKKLLSSIKELDDTSITNAIKLSGSDVAFAQTSWGISRFKTSLLTAIR